MILAFLLSWWKSIAALLVALIVGWCLWLWQPERQVRLHQRHLFEAAQARNWAKVEPFLDETFRTSGGHDKASALRQTREVLRQFFSVEITGTETGLALQGEEAKLATRVRFNGKGMPLADAVQDVINASPEPFEFTWLQQSWKPWDWKLVHVKHSIITRNAGNEWVF